jgi:hypothetical protein
MVTKRSDDVRGLQVPTEETVLEGLRAFVVDAVAQHAVRIPPNAANRKWLHQPVGYYAGAGFVSLLTITVGGGCYKWLQYH